MEDEIQRLIKVWAIAISLIIYCYYIPSRFPKGILRLTLIFPVIFVFTILPLNLSSIHFCAITALFLTWLCNFKLILFAYGLAPPLPDLLHFIAILSLPIKLIKIPQKSQKTSLDLAAKVFLLGIALRLDYDFHQRLNPHVLFGLHSLHLYLAVETILGLASLPATAILGASIERQFKQPLLCTSLQDFWGRRWNLAVSDVLRSTVYNPTQRLISGVFGRRLARYLAMIVVFTVSGLMHELIYYYFTRLSPTWEVAAFFVLNGVCTVAEVAAKEAIAGRVRLHRAVSGLLSLVFLGITSFWLLITPAARNGVDEKAIGESRVFVEFMTVNLSKGVGLFHDRLMLSESYK